MFLGRDYGHTIDYSQETAALIDEEIHDIISDCYKRCESILTEKKDKLETVANLLLEKEKIEADEFDMIFAENDINVEKTEDGIDANTSGGEEKAPEGGADESNTKADASRPANGNAEFKKEP